MFGIDFTLGNGWILSLLLIIISYAPMALGGKAAKRLTNFSWMSKKNYVYSSLIWLISILFLIIPVFSPITGNKVLLIVGVFLLVIGSIGTVISFHNYFTTPLDKLITKGMYQISRNPIYVFIFIVTTGIAVLCTSYVMAIGLILYFLLQHSIIIEEEWFCKENFDDEYEKYKKRTRRYL